MMKRFFFLLLILLARLSVSAASYSGTLPVLHIQTENNAPIVSKDDYIPATYYLDALNLAGYESIASAQAPLTMEIKGRGNYTWKDFDKKPYRIKLSDKQPLLGMKKSKHFALLAHADDSKAFMRNAVGFELGRLLNMAWTPVAKPVEVMLNGEYIGLYFLTETIRVDKDRVNIVEQEDMITDSEGITGGWLVEIDNYRDDPHVVIKEGDSRHTDMVFTYKTPEQLSNEQKQFLLAEMERINQLVYGDKNSDELWQYLDIDALARFYIVQEVMDNYESFHGSCYLYREKGEGEKWHFGPVWDFGSSFNRDKQQLLFEGDVWHNHWIPEICKFPAFAQYVKTLWNPFYAGAFGNIYAYVEQQQALIASAVQADYQRWPQYGNKDFANRVKKVQERLQKNSAWLNTKWNTNAGNQPNEENKDLALTAMCVWVNGQPVEYLVSQVDSITFIQKEGIVVKAKVPATWSDQIYVWIWGDGVSTNEFVAKKEGDWYVFAHDGSELNIIFKDGKGWKGAPYQTEDIYTKQSACYIIAPNGENKAKVSAVDCQ
jgi:hypothetical protein